MIATEAWVLDRGTGGNDVGELRLETFTFPDLLDDELLVEPLLGCWEGNMSHALKRHPVDICVQREESKVVIGNAGVVRVLRPGPAVTDLREGDLCIVFCNGVWDRFGYPVKIYAYDAPKTVGLLARRTKLHRRQLIPVPACSRYSLEQWATFSLRYITAWANWSLAFGCLQLQRKSGPGEALHIWGWGGGVTLAELILAKHAGCRVTMIASHDCRLNLIDSLGISSVDRREFPDLCFDKERYKREPAFRSRYLESEAAFLDLVDRETSGAGVSIFIDFIGQPVFRATLKSLARPGVVTTAGWKHGMDLQTVRAIECMNWHVHVHTHYARYEEGLAAVKFAEENDWISPVTDRPCPWECVPQMGRSHAAGACTSFFPLYQVNPV